MSNTVLSCRCGKRWAAPGAVPGRVGKCPACGDLMTVPHPTSQEKTERQREPKDRRQVQVSQETEDGGEGGYSVSSRAETTSYRSTLDRAPATNSRAEKVVSDGLIKVPKRLETSTLKSFLYPFWGSSGVAMLIFITPAMMFTGMMTVTVLTIISGKSAYIVPGVVLLIPSIFGVLGASTYHMLYISRVLVASAVGEIQQPRMPSWDFDEISTELGRWFVSILAGSIVGGLPMTAYWIRCGDLDMMDRVILVELASLASAYTLMALMAAILNESPLAANPITVFQGIFSVGTSWIKPSLVSGFVAMITFTLFMGSFMATGEVAAFLLYALACLAAVYGSIVVFRVLGLFYYHHADELGWYRSMR